MILLLSLAVSAAQAGWFQDFCERHLIADDPYQFEQTDLAYLIQFYDRLKMRASRDSPDRSEIRLLNIVRNELLERAKYASYADFEMIKKALTD